MIVSPIVNENINLVIKYPEIDYMTYRSLVNRLNNPISDILNRILKDIDFTRFDYHGIISTPKDYRYIRNCEEYYWYLLKINNAIIYNEYLDKLFNTHIKCVDYYNIVQAEKAITEQKTKKSTKRRKPKNIYHKIMTRNIFTSEVEYDYVNDFTGDKICSTDPNLLDTLNAKPKKVKKVKDSGVPLSAMTFKF